jgi:hypothetical protein
MKVTIESDSTAEALYIMRAVADLDKPAANKEEVPKKEEDTLAPKKSHSKTVERAKKATYFMDSRTKTFFKVSKGEPLPTGEDADNALEMDRSEWEKRQQAAGEEEAEKEEAEREVLPDPAEIPEEIKKAIDGKETQVTQVTLLDIKKAVKAKIMKDAALRVPLAELVGLFGADKLSTIDEDKYSDFLAEVQAL